MSELSKHTRLFKNVKTCKELNWQEKAILSEVISYQLEQKPFKLKDITLAIELGMDKGTISKLINRLYKKGLIDKTTISYPSQEGGKPKRLRTIVVKNITQWTEKDKVAPTIKAVGDNKKQEKAPVEVQPVSQLNKTPNENNVEDIPMLDVKTQVSTILWYYQNMAKQIRSGQSFEFIPVFLKHEDGSFTQDEAVKFKDGSPRYLVKSKLLKLEPNLFN